MKRTERARARRNIQRAFALARDVMDHPDRYPDRFIAIPLEPDSVSSLLSPQRIRLLAVLRESGPFASLGALARALGREETRVSRDVAQLAAAGLVMVARRGKAKVVRATNWPIVLA